MTSHAARQALDGPWSAEKADRLQAAASAQANLEDLEVLDAIVALPAMVAYRDRRHPELGTTGSYLMCPCVFCRVMGARADLRARVHLAAGRNREEREIARSRTACLEDCADNAAGDFDHVHQAALR